MPKVSRWFGVAVVLAATMATAGASRSVFARQAQADGTQSQFVGSDLYRNYCVTCHGKAGHGDGPLAEMLKKRPPDLTLYARDNNGVFPSEMVRKIIDGRQPVAGHGGKDMPVWGDAFKSAHGGSDEASIQARIEALVRHVESLQVKTGN